MNKTIEKILQHADALRKCNELEKDILLKNIEIECESLLGQDKDIGRGLWSVSSDGSSLRCDGFYNGALLKLSGDFIDPAERTAFAKGLAGQLNRPEILPSYPPDGLLESMALRSRHDFGLEREETGAFITAGVTKKERADLLALMRRLYDEVAGNGFFKWN